ncbi:Membrane-bound lytic murein transglycosylase D precursor [Enhygromyxa salina]|uniref:Membrane-bound lytic murein transglycosylase D n=1 Tax=Enhygromyxa salina TaxID=215803 RepID=A0A0C2D5H3_9BACT|nr:Membrane-bound lytic murein transglycosylase D precursor [Enhygromyxa salina]
MVVKGDSLWKLAEAHGCTVAQLRKANDMAREDALVLGTEIKLPSCAGSKLLEHVVVKGDSLEAIAAHYSTTVAALREHNKLDSNVIRVGQHLRIPITASAAGVRSGQSHGKVDDGRLEAPTQLPHSAAYYRRRLPRTYASEHLVKHTVRVVEAVRKHRPGVHRLAIGDLSAEQGGPLTGHRTHQSGRDIDLGFYFVDAPASYPSEFVPATRDNLDADATWELLEGFVRLADQPGGVALVYLDYEIQRLLYAAARRDGWTVEQLAEVFEYPDGRGADGRVVRHLWNHHDHLHVRFACPPADANCR